MSDEDKILSDMVVGDEFRVNDLVTSTRAIREAFKLELREIIANDETSKEIEQQLDFYYEHQRELVEEGKRLALRKDLTQQNIDGWNVALRDRTNDLIIAQAKDYAAKDFPTIFIEGYRGSFVDAVMEYYGENVNEDIIVEIARYNNVDDTAKEVPIIFLLPF